MFFRSLDIPGAYLLELELLEDERGFFARAWCAREFEARGLNPRLVQCSISFNKQRGILRGLHFQTRPHEEAKLVRCTSGGIYDVIVDLRTDSTTFRQWIAIELTAENHRMLYIPEGCAHGFQTLRDRTEVFYQMSEFYEPRAVRGVRWDDPALAIRWPLSQPILSERDLGLPILADALKTSAEGR
ncbi:MAG TPA: dTDP-4-dehydrorhamnose 3,5-epimerase [Gemmataceae bacterium]|nr:dTDP-4-dehydrorhamnose 3,5-epimerase [Gemmataceae bacterium]